MEHQHTEHVAAPPDELFAALADVSNLPHYVPQVRTARPDGDGTVVVEARYEGHTREGEAWFKADPDAKRIEWGSPGSDYHGSLEVAQDAGGSRLTLSLTTSQALRPDHDVEATLDAIRRLVERTSRSTDGTHLRNLHTNAASGRGLSDRWPELDPLTTGVWRNCVDRRLALVGCGAGSSVKRSDASPTR